MASEVFTMARIQRNVTEFLATIPSATTDELKKKQCKSLDYINQLAGLTKTSIIGWNVPGLFGTGSNGNELHTDKHEINKIFFQRIQSKATVTQSVDKQLEKLESMPKVAEALNKFGLGYVEKEKNKIKDQMNYAAQELKTYYNSVENKIKSITEFRTKIEALEGKNPAETLKRELAEVLSEGSWINPVFADGYLYVNTKNNVTISYKNKAANVDIDVNCGQLATKLHIETLNMRVIPYKNNIRSCNHFHPHVDFDGRICWGDARNQVAQWQLEGKIASIMKILYSLLYTYNDGNPYVHIQDFNSNSTKYGPIKDELKHPDKRTKTAEPPTIPVAATPELTIGGMPVFNVGDRVECESQLGADAQYARWDFETDENSESPGIEGCVLLGTVHRIGSHDIVVRFDNGNEWCWPLPNNSRYQEGLYLRRGYLRHATL